LWRSWCSSLVWQSHIRGKWQHQLDQRKPLLHFLYIEPLRRWLVSASDPSRIATISLSHSSKPRNCKGSSYSSVCRFSQLWKLSDITFQVFQIFELCSRRKVLGCRVGLSRSGNQFKQVFHYYSLLNCNAANHLQLFQNLFYLNHEVRLGGDIEEVIEYYVCVQLEWFPRCDE